MMSISNNMMNTMNKNKRQLQHDECHEQNKH